MRGLLAGVFVAVIAGLGIALVGSFGPAQAADVCPANPSPPDAADPSIVVDTPVDGATVSSPITIAGKARVFEAVVSITIFDAGGNVLADTTTMASEAGPTLAPYSAAVPFTTPQTQQGCVRVFEASAKDGSPVNVVQVEVVLAPPTKPPSTGDAGLRDESGGGTHIALYAAGFLALAGAAALAAERRLWS